MKIGSDCGPRYRFSLVHRTMIASSLLVCMVFLVAPAFAQEGSEAEKGRIASSTENPAGVPEQSDNTANRAELGTPVSANIQKAGNTPMPSKPSAARTDLSPRLLTFGDRIQLFRHSVFSPLTVIGPTVSAGVGLRNNEPPEWGQGAAGYGRRFGSSLGRNLTNKTIIFGVAALDGEDPRYIPSEQRGMMARTRHAVASTFVSRRSDGSRMPAVSLFAGAHGSAFIANSWYPPSKATTRHALEQGSSKLLSTLGLHLLQEFWPDGKHALHFKKQD